MSRNKSQISVTLSHGAMKYLDYICDRIPGRPSRSTVIHSIICGEINLSDYPAPSNIREEIEVALSQRQYQR